jgi:hypothetical protein
LETMTKDNDFDELEEIVAKAHEICNKILLFEAIDMEAEDVRLFLDCNRVCDHAVQDRYLGLVRKYSEKTSSSYSGNHMQ